MPTELSAGLRADLAAAAQDADSYHHWACQLYAEPRDEAGEEVPAICTCPGPGLLRELASVLEAGWTGPGVSARAA